MCDLAVRYGTTLWFQPGGGFKLEACRNISVEGLTIDYNPLPYIQASLTITTYK